MLWFCLMLMPTGPPAMKLTALADVNGSKESEKMAIAKFLTVIFSSLHPLSSGYRSSCFRLSIWSLDGAAFEIKLTTG